MPITVLKNNFNNIRILSKELLKGNPVIIPTETVYGIVAPIFEEEVIRKVFYIKKRSFKKPLSVIISKKENILDLSEGLDIKDRKRLQLLLEHFFPGPLTIVLKKNRKVPNIVTANQPFIGVRMPDHPVALSLIKTFGQPLIASSANRSGDNNPTTVEEVQNSLQNENLFVIDDGKSRYCKPSTVLKLDSSPILHRLGAISKDVIEDVLKEKISINF